MKIEFMPFLNDFIPTEGWPRTPIFLQYDDD